MTSPAFAPFHPQHKACADILSAQAFSLFFSLTSSPSFPFRRVSAVPSQCRCFAAAEPLKAPLFFSFPAHLFVRYDFCAPRFPFYTPNACIFPLFSLFNPPHSPCPPLTAASICCPPLLFLRLSAPRPSVVSPFCRLALLLSRLFVASFVCRFTLSPLFLFSFTSSHKTAAGKSCCFSGCRFCLHYNRADDPFSPRSSAR